MDKYAGLPYSTGTAPISEKRTLLIGFVEVLTFSLTFRCPFLDSVQATAQAVLLDCVDNSLLDIAVRTAVVMKRDRPRR